MVMLMVHCSWRFTQSCTVCLSPGQCPSSLYNNNSRYNTIALWCNVSNQTWYRTQNLRFAGIITNRIIYWLFDGEWGFYSRDMQEIGSASFIWYWGSLNLFFIRSNGARMQRRSITRLFSTKVKNPWSHTSTIPYVLLARYLVKHKD
jgi:hypothetical protein